MNKAIKVYIAGPLFSVAEREFNKRLADALIGRIVNCTVSLPQEYASAIAGKAGFLDDVFNYSLNSILNCDAVVAILDGPDADAGTCVEIGYAYALKKPIIGVRTDFRASEDRGVNLMVSKACTNLILLQGNSIKLDQVIDEVVRAVKGLFSTNG